jgi:uncharacterized protein (DUF169 family)
MKGAPMINYDFSILKRIGLTHAVVGVKFSLMKPSDLPRLQKKLAFCTMLKEAQENDGFYATVEEHGCKVGPYLLGQMKEDPVYEGGMIGPKLGVYEDARANRKIYTNMYKFAAGSVPYTWFARTDVITFNPDLMIVTAKPTQAEIIMRAHGYRSGAPWEAKGTTVVGCEYLYIYPYFTNKMNILISGLHHGMKARKTFEEGLLFITIPYELIPVILDNLETMEKENKIDLPQYHWGAEAHEKHMKEIGAKLAKEIETANARE